MPRVQRSRQKPRAAGARPLFGEIQTRLEVGAVDDPLELEAEHAAQQIMRDTSRPDATARGDAAVRRASAKSTKKQAEDEAEHEASKKSTHVARAAAPAHAGPGAHAVDASVERAIDGMRGTGHALDAETRSFMEERFGHSFENVRIHNSTAAATTAQALDARAFTSGSDIVFGPGEYRPHGDEGRMLLAHELAHVVQQSDGRQDLGLLRRQPDKPPAPSAAVKTAEATEEKKGKDGEAPITFIPKTSEQDGWISIDAKTKKGTMYLPVLQVPKLHGKVKGSASHNIEGLRGKPDEAKGKQPLEGDASFTYLGATPDSKTGKQQWLAKTRSSFSSGLAEKIRQKLKGSPKAAGVKDRENNDIYYLRLAWERSPIVLNGTPEELSRNENILIPVWTAQRSLPYFDVDHAQELQLGGADEWMNLCLLDRHANRSAGPTIYQNSFKKPVEHLVKLADTAEPRFWEKGRGATKPPTIEVVTNSWTIVFKRVVGSDIGIDGVAFWTRDQIRDGEQLKDLEFMSIGQLAKQGLDPNHVPGVFNLYNDEQGGMPKQLAVKGGKVEPPKKRDGFYGGFNLKTIDITAPTDVVDGRRLGKLSGTVFRKQGKDGQLFETKEIDLDVIQSKRLGFGGLVDKTTIVQVRNLLGPFKPLCPFEIDEAGLQGDALYARGRIKAEMELFKGLEVPFLLLGDDFQLELPIPVGALKLGPLKVTDAALTLGMLQGDVTYGGYIAFQVARLGSGMLEAEKLDLKGRFDFDTDLFKPASVEVSYIDDQLSAAAKLGLAEGKVPGLRSAVLTVAMGPQGVSLEGTAHLGIPALQGTTLTIGWSPETGLTIGADDIPLPVSSIPGVQSATASIHVKENPKTGELEVSGGGTALLGVPGATGSIGVAVKGAGLTISGEAAIARGMLNGSLRMTVTNLPVDEAGNPVEGEPGPHMTVFGHGQATVQFGPILRGTVGLELTPDGQMQLSGGIALPPVVDVFDERRFDKELFKSPAIDIPIIGFSALGHRVGIFFTLGGSLGFEAAVGPGQLRDTQLNVEYNPDQPEKAHIAGGAHFVVPAHAGLVLEVHGALAAGIPIVDAEAGVKMTGNLGIAGEASADVLVDWTPASGLVLDAKAEIKASPRFRIDINAYLNVSLDLLLKTVELYDKKWELASFEFGPSLEVGVSLPVHWDETHGLALSTDQIEIHKPDIDVLSIAKDLFHEIV